jgi:hypothetical protein
MIRDPKQAPLDVSICSDTNGQPIAFIDVPIAPALPFDVPPAPVSSKSCNWYRSTAVIG